MGNYAAGYESWGIKIEKGWNGLDSMGGRLMFIEKLPVGWDRDDIFFVYPQITQIKGDYVASGKLGNKKRKRNEWIG
jgi:hypothetical protein